MGGEAMIPYLARFLDITINNGTIPRDWKKAMVVPIYKGGGGSFGCQKLQAGQFNLSSMEHVIAWYIRQEWGNSACL
jgi:hypothetical protein